MDKNDKIKYGEIFQHGFVKFLGRFMCDFFSTYGLPIEYQFDYLLGDDDKVKRIISLYYLQEKDRDVTKKIMSTINDNQVLYVRSLITYLSENIKGI